MAMGTAVTTPTVVTSVAKDLVLAGIAFYTGSSMMTAPSGWTLDQDEGYFAAAEWEVAEAAGSSVGGMSMGTVTGLTHPATSTILALEPR